MKKLFLVLLILAFGITPCYSANEWRNGSADFIDGDTALFNNVDTDISDYVNEPLERLHVNAREGAMVAYATAATVTVTRGALVCSNSGGTIRKMRRNTSSTTVTWSDIDTGSEEASTSYNVFGNCDADATTFTIKISKSSTPTGVTSYRKLGTFYNNSSSNVAYITNNDGIAHHEAAPYDLSEGTSYSAGTTYQNTTGHKLLIVWYGKTNYSGGWHEMVQDGQIGEVSASTTVAKCRAIVSAGAASAQYCANTFVVPEGWYWKITNSAGDVGSTTGTVSRIEAWEI